jgi:SAM-dependent methyltransferase
MKRWQRAQEYERSYWETQAAQIATGTVAQFDWYRWRADQLMHKLRVLGLDTLSNGHARVVEVGSGPIGVVPFLPAAERVAVDPLEPFYATNPVLTALRPSDVEYRPGLGEQLPCETGRYDLAMIENCIDHVQNPSAVRAELYRVLKPDGILYLTVNCRTAWGYRVHRVLSRLRLDPGHPYTFTPARARTFLERGQFKILSHEVGSYVDAWRADFRGPAGKTRVKAFLGVSEFLFSAISRRVAAPTGR